MESNLRTGDAITIEEVRGDRARFEVNGAYVVRGTYELESADQADLTFTEQVVDSGVCTSSSGRDKLIVKRGTGKFELATTLPVEGFAHLSFSVDGRGVGGVLFGRTPTVAQKAQGVAATVAK